MMLKELIDELSQIYKEYGDVEVEVADARNYDGDSVEISKIGFGSRHRSGDQSLVIYGIDEQYK